MMELKKTLLIILFLLMVLPFGFAQQGTKDSVVALEVNFELDRHSLRQSEKDKVDSILDLVPMTVLEKVEIYGHTDSLAGIDYNRHLSKRRVQSILKYLVYKGLDPLKVKADYYGEERPKYQNTPEERYRNRRCELYFVVDPSLIPPPEQKLTDLEFKTGDRIRIPNLNFVGNQPVPISESFESLKDLLRVMQKYPDLIIELHGHVCCGNDEELSVERAKMVYGFLAGNGVDPDRMSYKGFSNRKPLFPERTAEEKALNRRVEVYVVDNSGETASIPEEELKIDLRAPVLNVKFFPNKGKLYPSGDFMLTLIADMMKEPADLFYEFVIFDNINDGRLTRTRAGNMERALGRMKVDPDIFRVRTSPKMDHMPDSENNNLMMVKITKR